MDRVSEYREIIKRVLREWADYATPEPECKNVLVLDEDSDNYVFIYTGWRGNRYVNHTLIHLSIQDGKIHVLHDGVEDGVVPDLLKAGVPEKEIVIEWHPPSLRKYTDFAVA